jgi:hypothetical protein
MPRCSRIVLAAFAAAALSAASASSAAAASSATAAAAAAAAASSADADAAAEHIRALATDYAFYDPTDPSGTKHTVYVDLQVINLRLVDARQSTFSASGILYYTWQDNALVGTADGKPYGPPTASNNLFWPNHVRCGKRSRCPASWRLRSRRPDIIGLVALASPALTYRYLQRHAARYGPTGWAPSRSRMPSSSSATHLPRGRGSHPPPPARRRGWRTPLSLWRRSYSRRTCENFRLTPKPS